MLILKLVSGISVARNKTVRALVDTDLLYMVRWLPIATDALILSLAAKIGFVKIVIDLKNS